LRIQPQEIYVLLFGNTRLRRSTYPIDSITRNMSPSGDILVRATIGQQVWKVSKTGKGQGGESTVEQSWQMCLFPLVSLSIMRKALLMLPKDRRMD
jgi:hypothetical protein